MDALPEYAGNAKPCPKCGNASPERMTIQVDGQWTGQAQARLICENCDYTGPYVSAIGFNPMQGPGTALRELVVQAWNRSVYALPAPQKRLPQGEEHGL